MFKELYIGGAEKRKSNILKGFGIEESKEEVIEKARVKSHTRKTKSGKLSQVKEYQDSRTKKKEDNNKEFKIKNEMKEKRREEKRRLISKDILKLFNKDEKSVSKIEDGLKIKITKDLFIEIQHPLTSIAQDHYIIFPSELKTGKEKMIREIANKHKVRLSFTKKSGEDRVYDEQKTNLEKKVVSSLNQLKKEFNKDKEFISKFDIGFDEGERENILIGKKGFSKKDDIEQVRHISLIPSHDTEDSYSIGVWNKRDGVYENDIEFKKLNVNSIKKYVQRYL